MDDLESSNTSSNGKDTPKATILGKTPIKPMHLTSSKFIIKIIPFRGSKDDSSPFKIPIFRPGYHPDLPRSTPYQTHPPCRLPRFQSLLQDPLPSSSLHIT